MIPFTTHDVDGGSGDILMQITIPEFHGGKKVPPNPETTEAHSGQSDSKQLCFHRSLLARGCIDVSSHVVSIESAGAWKLTC